MKKIVIALVIIAVSIITSIIIVLSIPKGYKEVKIEGFNSEVTLNLGKYKVKNYKKTKISGDCECVEFNVNSTSDYYNNVIKKSDLYMEDLDFDVENYDVFGFLYKENTFFKYTIKDGLIHIESSIGSYYDNQDKSNMTKYYIPGPFAINSSYTSIQEENNSNFFFDTLLSDKNINFDMIKIIISHLDEDYWKYENEEIYIKGFYYFEKIKGQEYVKTISNDYLFKIREENNIVRVRLKDYE